MALQLYERYFGKQAVELLGGSAGAKYYCGRQFVVTPTATLCFATLGNPDEATHLATPSSLVWRPARLDYHPSEPLAWFHSALTVSIERQGKWLPLVHVFLRRRATERKFTYAGIAELGALGDISDLGQVGKAAHFTLDAKLPRKLWVRFGGYAGWLVTCNRTRRRLERTEVEAFEKLLTEVPSTPGYWSVSLIDYDERWLGMLMNATRARICHHTRGRNRSEAYDPNFAGRKGARESFGNDGQIDVILSAERTVPRELALRAALEFFQTGVPSRCISWRAEDGAGK